MVFPVVGQALAECTILLGCDITGIESPNGFHLVEFLVQHLLLLDLDLLLGLVVLILDLLNLGLLTLLGLSLSLLILNFLKHSQYMRGTTS